jgi:hypothetical protein
MAGALLPPQLVWSAPGTTSRVSTVGCAGACAPPSLNFPGFMDINRTQDVVVSVTRVAGTHTAKAGLSSTTATTRRTSLEPDFQGLLNFGNDTTNPLDTGFPFANAATGVFSSRAAVELHRGQLCRNNLEWYCRTTGR